MGFAECGKSSSTRVVLDDVSCQGVVLFIDCNIFNFHCHIFNLCFSYCLLLYFVVSFKLNIRS